MNDALTCPACEAQLRTRDELLAHAWKHLRYIDPNTNYPIGSRACCWCGEWFIYHDWMKHMWMLDAQAHYLAHALGVGR